MAIMSGIFDAISHPDYFRKYQKTPAEWSQYGGTVIEAIDSLKSYGVGFEINTSGYRHGIGDKFPRDDFIKAASKAGVKTVTLGSDSHHVETIGYKITNTAQLLKNMGYTSFSTFNARKETTNEIDKMLKRKRNRPVYTENML